MSNLTDKLNQYAANDLNVILVGAHGIGKSTIVKSVADKLKLKFKYYSSSTLDPWAELVGIPVPDKESGKVKFYRPEDLEDAEFVFFDELNRAHPRVLNTVLEIIQFKSINGVPLKNLKMVWAAVNPPGEDYQVEELDPALLDRFHIYVNMKPEINSQYLKSKISEPVVKIVKDWWENDLSDVQRKTITPRRIEYIGLMIDKNISWRDALPIGQRFPVEELIKKIRVMNKEDDDIDWTKENIIAKKDELLEKMKENPKYAIKLAQSVGKFNEKQLFECRDLVEQMPKELIKNSVGKKFAVNRTNLKKMFEDAAIDVNLYPKTMEAIVKGSKD